MQDLDLAEFVYLTYSDEGRSQFFDTGPKSQRYVTQIWRNFYALQ